MTQSAGPPFQATPVAPLPGWLAPLVTVTTQVGVPTVVAGVLLYFVLFRVDGALKVIQENEETRTRIIAAMQDSLVAALDRQTKSFGESMRENINANKDIAARMERTLVPFRDPRAAP